MDACNNHIENNKTTQKNTAIRNFDWLWQNKYATKTRSNRICIPAGDNQNTCTLLLSHFIIYAQHNVTSEKESEKFREGKVDRKRAVSMMRGVIIDLNQIFIRYICACH
jgi:hypothetical protein